jgi:hypothetical protein
VGFAVCVAGCTLPDVLRAAGASGLQGPSPPAASVAFWQSQRIALNSAGVISRGLRRSGGGQGGGGSHPFSLGSGPLARCGRSDRTPGAGRLLALRRGTEQGTCSSPERVLEKGGRGLLGGALEAPGVHAAARPVGVGHAPAVAVRLVLQAQHRQQGGDVVLVCGRARRSATQRSPMVPVSEDPPHTHTTTTTTPTRNTHSGLGAALQEPRAAAAGRLTGHAQLAPLVASLLEAAAAGGGAADRRPWHRQQATVLVVHSPLRAEVQPSSARP